MKEYHLDICLPFTFITTGLRSEASPFSGENEHVDIGCKEENGTNWETGIDIYTMRCIKQIMGTAVRPRKLGLVFRDDAEGWGGDRVGVVLKGRDICGHVADTLHCMVETNTIL